VEQIRIDQSGFRLEFRFVEQIHHGVGVRFGVDVAAGDVEREQIVRTDRRKGREREIVRHPEPLFVTAGEKERTAPPRVANPRGMPPPGETPAQPGGVVVIVADRVARAVELRMRLADAFEDHPEPVGRRVRGGIEELPRPETAEKTDLPVPGAAQNPRETDSDLGEIRVEGRPGRFDLIRHGEQPDSGAAQLPLHLLKPFDAAELNDRVGPELQALFESLGAVAGKNQRLIPGQSAAVEQPVEHIGLGVLRTLLKNAELGGGENNDLPLAQRIQPPGQVAALKPDFVDVGENLPPQFVLDAGFAVDRTRNRADADRAGRGDILDRDVLFALHEFHSLVKTGNISISYRILYHKSPSMPRRKPAKNGNISNFREMEEQFGSRGHRPGPPKETQ